MAKRREVTADEIKSIALEGLRSITSICDKYNLRYYLAFGTLLGAVRHKGFIPWDDDIDLFLPREDYHKLEALAAEIKSPDWELLSYNIEPKYMIPFMKYCNRRTTVEPSRFCNGFLYGLSIDLFPLDYFGEKDEKAVKDIIVGIKYPLKEQELKCYKTGVLKTGAINQVKRTIKTALYLMNLKKVEQLRKDYKRLDEQLASYVQKGDEYAAFMYNRYDTVWKKKDFTGDGDQYSIVSFEGYEFKAPYDYHTVLQKTYGDYMKFPPKEKQVPIHLFVAYYKD